jgi:sulfate adenylyltransferase subunit 1 (EFTu-like GTPase family)
MIVLVDARNGVRANSQASIINYHIIEHLIIVTINKMDLVDYAEDVCNNIAWIMQR